jgi:ribosomal protein L30/L7E
VFDVDLVRSARRPRKHRRLLKTLGIEQVPEQVELTLTQEMDLAEPSQIFDLKQIRVNRRMVSSKVTQEGV